MDPGPASTLKPRQAPPGPVRAPAVLTFALALAAVLALPGCIQVTIGSPGPSPAPPDEVGLSAPEKAASEPFAVDFHWTPQQPRANQTVQFQASVTGLDGRTVSDWHWDWGDGGTGAGTRASHAWKAPALDGYDVTLRVLTSQGEVVERSHNILVLGTR